MILKDNKGNDYKVQDLKEFKNHILNYHTRNGEADYSIHEENGSYFTITPSLLKKILNE